MMFQSKGEEKPFSVACLSVVCRLFVEELVAKGAFEIACQETICLYLLLLEFVYILRMSSALTAFRSCPIGTVPCI